MYASVSKKYSIASSCCFPIKKGNTKPSIKLDYEEERVHRKKVGDCFPLQREMIKSYVLKQEYFLDFEKLLS